MVERETELNLEERRIINKTLNGSREPFFIFVEHSTKKIGIK